MRTKTLIIFVILAVCGMLFMPALVPNQVFASNLFSGADSQACQGLNAGSPGNACNNNNAKSLSNTVKNVINVLTLIVGVAAVVVIIVGGLMFVTSGGESSKTAAARNVVLYALIGLVVAAIGQVLVHFVLGKINKS